MGPPSAWVPHTFGGLTPPDPPLFRTLVALTLARWRAIFNLLYNSNTFRYYSENRIQKIPIVDSDFPGVNHAVMQSLLSLNWPT